MVKEMEVMDNAGLFTDRRDISMVEMGHDSVNISCTQGKIIIWFGRQVNETLVRQVIFGISNVDSSVNYEQEVICEYGAIAEYENMGYILTSYAKSKGGYRAIFNVPFSRRFALAHFVKSIVDQLKERDVKKTLHWDGSLARISLIYDELKNIDGWGIKKIEYKSDDGKGV